MAERLTIPPTKYPIQTWLPALRRLAHSDLPAARRAAFLRLIWQEAYLTREGLIARIEDVLYLGCFGPSPEVAFRQDVALIRRRLAGAGYWLRYSRQPDNPGYYIDGRPRLDPHLQQLIAGSVAEVDPQQMHISSRLTPAQRFRQGYSMTRLAEQVVTYRRRQTASQTEQSNHLIRERNSMETMETTGSDLEFGEFMRLVLDALEAAGVEYMIAGAVAVWAWGDARTTRDFDLVVNIPFDNIPALSTELEKRAMLVPVEVILDLLTTPAGDLPINAIHLYTGYKAELFLLRPGDVFRETALARRRLIDLGSPLGQVYVHAPEDLILNKIRYFGLSHQPKHTRDIAGIILALGDQLDVTYLENWAARLGLLDLWQEIQQEIQE